MPPEKDASNSYFTPEIQENLARVAEQLAQARRVAVLTGAGVSKESGIPTFRDAQTGLWANASPEDLASRPGFTKNPRLVWEWYDYRRNRAWQSPPNDGHHALVQLESRINTRAEGHFTLITQNVDNLHTRAGSQQVLELHGNIFHYKCLDCDRPIELQLDPSRQPDPAEPLPPRCPQCNGYVRPDVVWFGEALPEKVLREAYRASETAEVMLVVGTSGVVYPAADLPMAAKRHGAFLAEINPEPSALTPAMDAYLAGPSAQLLPALLACLPT
jgi:NAD-dependent deacetylase